MVGKLLLVLVLVLLFFVGSNTIRQQNIARSLTEFETVCTDECAVKADRSACAPLCRCMLETMRDRHGSDAELVAYLVDLGERFERTGERGTPELQPIADACAVRVLR